MTAAAVFGKRRIRAGAVAALAALALTAAACAPTVMGPAGGDPHAADEAVGQDGVDIRPHPQEVRRPDAEDVPEVPELAAADLMGLPAEGVAELLGTPMRQRNEGPADVWQYRSEDCVLDLFLYPEPGDTGLAPAVDHVEARDRAANLTEIEPCLRAVLLEKARSQAPVSS